VSVRPPPRSPVKVDGREWGAVATALVLTEGGLLMKLKTNLKAGQVFQSNTPLQQASGGGGGQTANQSNPFAVNFV
jgi:hypothetical protein